MSFANNLKQTALELINKYGNDMTLQNIVQNPYDPTTGKVPPPTITNTELKGTFENYASEEIQGSIQQGDIKVIISTDEVPTVEDKIVFQGVTYSMVNVVKVIAQNTTVIYELQVRL